MHNINSAVVYNRPELRLELFKELDSETNSKEQLSKQVFAYFLQKHAQGRSESGDVIKPLREFLLPTPAQLADNDASSVYYMDLLDESADSEETLAEVAEMLSEINSTYGADASVLVQMSTELAQTSMHCYNLKHLHCADTM